MTADRMVTHRRAVNDFLCDLRGLCGSSLTAPVPFGTTVFIGDQFANNVPGPIRHRLVGLPRGGESLLQITHRGAEIRHELAMRTATAILRLARRVGEIAGDVRQVERAQYRSVMKQMGTFALLGVAGAFFVGN